MFRYNLFLAPIRLACQSGSPACCEAGSPACCEAGRDGQAKNKCTLRM
ncbi:MAG: hypothetical protein WAU01_11580 [Saprospiraceae bacterium]